MYPKTFIVITSIFKETEAVKKYSKKENCTLVVVGDKKTPKNWCSKNTIYLSPEDQQKLKYEIIKTLPWNHYCRKMIGYLYAVEKGAEIIIDTDDDNIPVDNWKLPEFKGTFLTYPKNKNFVNVYNYFTEKKNLAKRIPS